MTEYTSLDVSKRLKEAGFEEEYDERCWLRGTAVEAFLGYRTPDFTDAVIADAYRLDTLIQWLVNRGFEVLCKPKAKDTDKNLPDDVAEVILAVLAKEAKHE